jgi:hypothetical protein
VRDRSREPGGPGSGASGGATSTVSDPGVAVTGVAVGAAGAAVPGIAVSGFTVSGIVVSGSSGADSGLRGAGTGPIRDLRGTNALKRTAVAPEGKGVH